jgi:glucokinase
LQLKYLIAVDVGGTNCRVSVSLAHEALCQLKVAKFQVDDVALMLDAFVRIAARLGAVNNGIAPVAAAIDVAGPVAPDRQSVQLTNYPAAHERTLKLADLPAALFPRGRTTILNDLEASCHGLLALNSLAQLGTYFSHLIGPAPAVPATVSLDVRKHYVVAAAGTGLGVGLLIASRGQHIVLPCEFGHVLVYPRASAQADAALETKLQAYLSEKVYQSQHAIEVEDIVSGRGVVWCYQFLLAEGHAGADNRTAADVARDATADATCKLALQLHYRYLLRCCSQICVGVQAKGVLLCGDNQASNMPFIRQHVDTLRDAFLDTAKRDWLADAVVYTQSQSLNANLLGCARVAAQTAAEHAMS